jgi:hypothetical protein
MINDGIIDVSIQGFGLMLFVMAFMFLCLAVAGIIEAIQRGRQTRKNLHQITKLKVDYK